MKKIGVVTLYSELSFNNFGGVLQNYALVSYLNNINYSANTIGFTYSDEIFHWYWRIKRILYSKAGLLIEKKNNRYAVTNIGIDKQRNKKFRDFQEKNIPLKKYWISNGNYGNINNEYDRFIAGSDQIWNPEWAINGKTFYSYFLTFAENEKRLSYAASFGKCEIPDTMGRKIAPELKKFKNLSVREEAGAEIIKQLSGRNAEVSIDPTLLLTRKQWAELAEEPNININKKYILTYFLGGISEELRAEINKKASENNFVVYDLLDKNNKKLYVSGPSEFLYLIEHAELIMTDSFHACVFSFIFERPFLAYRRNGSQANTLSRIETFVKTFGLEKKLADSQLGDNIFETDYSYGYMVLERKRKESAEYIKNIIEN